MTDLENGFFGALARSQAAGETVAVATIVRARGSVPRSPGARMLVRADGSTTGTVGGGCGEADVWRAALETIADGQPRTVVVDLTAEIALSADGVCGGTMDVFVEAWDGGARQNGHRPPAALTADLVEALAGGRSAVLATVVEATGQVACAPAERLLVVDGADRGGTLDWPPLRELVFADAADVLAGRRSALREYDFTSPAGPGRSAVFFDVIEPRPALVVVGAGHIAVPLAEVGALLGFDVIVVDDRPSLADPARFPTASQVIADDIEAALDRLPFTPSTYVVLVTRGHAHDVQALRRILGRPRAYVGMIGSRRRVFAVFKLLRDEGVPLEQLLQVRAPIGVDVDAETPAEIAIGVGAELLQVRRGGRVPTRSERVRDDYAAALADGAAALA